MIAPVQNASHVASEVSTFPAPGIPPVISICPATFSVAPVVITEVPIATCHPLKIVTFAVLFGQICVESAIAFVILAPNAELRVADTVFWRPNAEEYWCSTRFLIPTTTASSRYHTKLSPT